MNGCRAQHGAIASQHICRNLASVSRRRSRCYSYGTDGEVTMTRRTAYAVKPTNASGQKHASGPHKTSEQKLPPRAAASPALPPLSLPVLFTVLFAGFTLLPRVNANPHLRNSFLLAARFLATGVCALWWSVA